MSENEVEELWKAVERLEQLVERALCRCTSGGNYGVGEPLWTATNGCPIHTGRNKTSASRAALPRSRKDLRWLLKAARERVGLVPHRHRNRTCRSRFHRLVRARSER